MEAVAELEQSGLFDADWYLSHYADVAASGMSAAEHFLWLGHRLGRRPSPAASFADVRRPVTGIETSPRTGIAKRGPLCQRTVVRERAPAIDQVLPYSVPAPSRWLHNTVAISRNRPRALEPLTRSFNPRALNLHWIVPDFGPGGGGHMSIFRMIHWLERFGHRQTIWIQNPVAGNTERLAYERIREWYQPIDRVVVRFLPEDVEGISGDAVIATDMWTPFPASNMPLMKERFYLVQDYEALFHTHGSFSYLADHTYRLGFKIVCAGAWLRQVMENRFGLWARDWELAFDPTYYYVRSQSDKMHRTRPRIAFYARQSTPRRAVELGREALSILHERGISFQVDFFGQDDLGAQPPYAHVHHGLLTPHQLGELYRSADIGLVFSATNYSLIPMEMMACGLPVIEIDTESTRAVFPDDAVCFASPDPHSIADAVQKLVENESVREVIRSGGQKYVAKLSWEKSARALEAALIEGLSEHNEAVTPEAAFTHRDYDYKAAVIIPTWNGGAFFREVLEAVVTQETPWPFDILVVDSGSSDETLDIIRDFASRGVRLHIIQNAEFQHGRTRNLAISLTDAEFVAVLTQDARPTNRNWLVNLVKAFDAAPNVAGVFGAHIAHPGASAATASGLDAHFRHFGKLPQVAHWDIDLPPALEFGSLGWQQWLHYYSDNNSCLRRSVWEKIPYPEIEWGEDQVWAWEIIKQGYAKAFAPDAIVAHSHDLTTTDQAKVSRIEGDFWMRYFSYRFESDPDQVQASIDFLDRSAGCEGEASSKQAQLHRASVRARYIGQHALIEAWRHHNL